ncbi:MAG: di-heme oxidoredictase family protein [Cyclobacteriaceae bacterium]
MRSGFFTLAILTSACLVGFLSCEEIIPSGPTEDEILDGPVHGLNGAEQRQFLAGDIAFNDEIFTTENGLGPRFVATSCGSCHAGDGKGHPFTTLTRFGQVDNSGNQYLDQGGPQLQNRAIPGHTPEQLPAGATFSRITPPANTGLGFLEALTDAQLLAHADPLDANGDGISGAPNYIDPPPYFIPQPHHESNSGKFIGRFGKKASAINLLHQTVNAYNQDIGITSSFNPFDPASGVETDPEIADQTIHDVVFYLQTLKAPVQRHQHQPEVMLGKEVFIEAGCGKCHIESFITPSNSKIPAISNKQFYPYTDLLLHDMGPDLDDGYTEGTASTNEWRTPPLWGLGLSPNSQGGTYFLLHDGRARSIEEAIELHGGEAAVSKNNYLQLPSAEKSALIKFLKSL